MSGLQSSAFPFQPDNALMLVQLPWVKKSSTPIGASDQPLKYPSGKHSSVYMFPSTYCGIESWPALFAIMKQSISGCSIIVRQVYSKESSRWKFAYHMSCSHCCHYESNSGATYTDNCVGAINTISYLVRFVL
jgi:hypothetical protein